jgi:hypothetical protein
MSKGELLTKRALGGIWNHANSATDLTAALPYLKQHGVRVRRGDVGRASNISPVSWSPPSIAACIVPFESILSSLRGKGLI